MRSRVPVVVVLAVGVLAGGMGAIGGVPTAEAFCSSTAQCPNHMVCQEIVLGIKECRQKYCNSDANCPSDRRSCSNGICQSLTSGPPPSSGMTPSGPGGPCGQIRLGQVTKSQGCRPGLVCVKVPASSPTGRCQRPPA